MLIDYLKTVTLTLSEPQASRMGKGLACQKKRFFAALRMTLCFEIVSTGHFITSNLVMSFREIAVFAVTNEFLDSRPFDCAQGRPCAGMTVMKWLVRIVELKQANAIRR